MLNEWFVEQHEYDFQDGGCLILAEALVKWSDGRLSLAASSNEAMQPGHRRRRAQHLLAEWSGPSGEALYLDSDGLGTHDDVLRKATILELMPPQRIDPYPAGFARDAIPRPGPSTDRIAGNLAQIAGRFASWRHPAAS